MALMRHDVVLPYSSSLPEDVSIQTFWTKSSETPEIQAIAASEALADFYTVAGGAAEYPSIDYYLSPVMDYSSNACTIRSYDMGDPEPRTPVLEAPFTLNENTGTVGGAEEVALCMSFHALFEAGVPKARRRGRVYLGPFNSDVGEVVGSRVLPSTGVVDSIRQQAATLLLALRGTVEWSVYSRVDDEAHVVVGGWVDRQWDTQRRRGVARPAGRFLWDASWGD